MLNHKGVTLLEAVVVISIFTTASVVVTSVIIQGLRVNSFANEQNEALNNARRGVEFMIKEIREASTSENGSFPISAADAQELIFYSDLDIDQETERIRYFLDGTDLKKGVIEPVGVPGTYPSGNEVISILSEYVRNGADPIFYYYNEDWPADQVSNPLTQPVEVDDIKFVKTYLKINIDPTKAPNPAELESSTTIRNLKDNL
ncbi:MAG: hypothetical protein COT81_00350 [Candidatus Buchananbacteria bacterium CG10_big_fil_rev_8_21_14_0_10_42_9]|uniref:Type II secretion system protein J n=1 Tax=Candidatus Buchananbacteria bacterium CG10_big_fil_rev_8_21_14_0_10_42_9 TaxID=1974526 RepID=A0A2H0W2K8_9BACT|nr:MAG: hypothetical protein COT81_00350 [Candidatus Buchananbacteria bacterium CG10_big_fil_rev_8_21_14_0_10_42_9]